MKSLPPARTRALKKPEHFQAYLGAQVDVKFYQAKNGQKTCTGILAGYEDGAVTLTMGEDTVTFPSRRSLSSVCTLAFNILLRRI